MIGLLRGPRAWRTSRPQSPVARSRRRRDRTPASRGSFEPTLRQEEAKDGAPSVFGWSKGGPPDPANNVDIALVVVAAVVHGGEQVINLDGADSAPRAGAQVETSADVGDDCIGGYRAKASRFRGPAARLRLSWSGLKS